MTHAAGLDPSRRTALVEELRKEAYTMALYVGVCLLAALLAVPEADEHAHTFGIVWGVTVGLALAHWFAFRLSGRLVGRGTVDARDAAVAGAQVAGAAAVALLATVGVVLSPSHHELEVTEAVLGCFIGLVGFAVARAAGASRSRALLYALTVLVLALGIALLKNALAGH